MRRLSVVLLVALAVVGCKKQEPAAAQQNAGAPAAVEVGSGAPLTGKVLERLDSPPYSYLRIQTAQGETWAAVPKADVANGAEVTVAGALPMKDFESKTLARKFDVVYFGTLGDADAAAAPAGGGAMGGAPMGGGMGGPAMGGAQPSPAAMAAQHAAAAAGPSEVGDVKVPKASGGDARTVAEVWGQRATLKEKSVTVRGKVVKFNEGIMGRNWLHLRDGTGANGKDNDITVTTGDLTKVGEVVVVKGTVRVDKDFGAGYAYPVIIEDAKVSK
jgi:hypothetical protein